MIQDILKQTVAKLMTPNKGILAADESNETAGKRLAEYGIENSTENRRQYRELFFATPEIEKYISGVIMYDETFWQKSGEAKIDGTEVYSDGPVYPKFLTEKGIVPGIKVDLGAKDFAGFPDEKITVGLDDLQLRAQKYFENGARFTKWRSVIKIDEVRNLPTDAVIDANNDAMARYVKIVQEIGLVPIVEPEVLMEGSHSITKCAEITEKVLQNLFDKLKEFNVFMPGLILKTGMIIQGDAHSDENSPQEIAAATLSVLKKVVPTDIGGVVFLSGGQTPVEATAHFDAIVELSKMAKHGTAKFETAFSYARALQEGALRVWSGKKENIKPARIVFLKRLKFNSMADSGEYDITMEYLK